MQSNTHPGKFIVFEGIDGSGKATQAALLREHLENNGGQTAYFSFPRYGNPSAIFVEMYLRGDFGPAESISPRVASYLYSLDRFAARAEIRNGLLEGKNVISDRYTASNAGHQGGKIKDIALRKEFLKWLWTLEYEELEIPKPDITIILQLTPEQSFDLNKQKSLGKIQERIYLRDKQEDEHENLQHLIGAYTTYQMLPEFFPDEFITINCVENGILRTPENIHQEVWQYVTKII